jgi:hypothetical protein
VHYGSWNAGRTGDLWKAAEYHEELSELAQVNKLRTLVHAITKLSLACFLCDYVLNAV